MYKHYQTSVKQTHILYRPGTGQIGKDTVPGRYRAGTGPALSDWYRAGTGPIPDRYRASTVSMYRADSAPVCSAVPGRYRKPVLGRYRKYCMAGNGPVPARYSHVYWANYTQLDN